MPFLHAHRRRVPTQDVDRSVVIGMGAEAAMPADKGRLAFAASAVHGSAFRTGLRGIGGIDLQKVSPALFELVGKDGLEAEPALIENAPVEPRLLPHHAARFFHRAPRGGCHVFDAQIFEDHGSEAPAHVERRLVLPIAADVGTFGGQPECATDGCQSPLRPLLSAPNDVLRGTAAPLDSFERGRDGQMLAGGERQRIGDATINADRWTDIDWRDMVDLASETDMPAERVHRDGNILDRAAQRAAVAELDPTDLGQAHGRPFAVELPDLDLAALKPESVVDALAARRRVAGTSGEEVRECLVEIAERLLLARLRNGGDPIELGAKLRQFASLRDVVEFGFGSPLELPPPVVALFEREVVDETAHASELPERGFLIGGRSHLVSEATKDHAANIAVGLTRFNVAENVDVRKGRHVVYALHAHLVFVTKYRRDALSELAICDLSRIFTKVCKDFGAELIECNGEDDHVHLLVVYPPKVVLSKLVNSLKGVSSRLLRERRLEVCGRYKNGVLWSPSYFVASCGGAPLTVIAEYVRSQREAPSGRSRLPPRPKGRGFSRGSR